MFRDSEVLHTEEAVNQTYNLLNGILMHFKKFEGLHKIEPSTNTSSLYSYNMNKNTQTSAFSDKKQQFLQDQVLIEKGLNQLNEAVATHAEQLVTHHKTTP